MAKNQRERSRMRDAFLGFPSSLDPDPTLDQSGSTPLTPIGTEASFDPVSDQEQRRISHPKQPRTWEDLTYGTTTTFR